MRYVAPCRPLIWLAAAVVGWAVVIGMCLWLPQAFAGVAVAAVLLWRRSQHPVDPALSSRLAVADQSRDDVRQLVSTSV